jgi:hypothetical protein
MKEVAADRKGMVMKTISALAANRLIASPQSGRSEERAIART